MPHVVCGADQCESPHCSHPTWTEDPIGIFSDAGDVGGDHQAGPSFSRRFIFGPVTVDGEDRWMVADVYAFAVDLDVYTDDDDLDGPRRYGSDELTMLTICTDPSDPGSTEIHGSCEPGPGGYLIHTDVDRATAEARRLIERTGVWIFEHYDPTDDLRRGFLR